ncbi:MAG TPA: TerC family protein, partial [Burkholderiales bacterium]|nr:TerC family protein [Burkholderiales bacterium]
FLTLLALEVVLGIDNVIFIAILSGKLPESQSGRARATGIGLAVITRILLLLGITWVMQLTTPIFTLGGVEFSGRDLILILGGLFLIWKSTSEIHGLIEGDESHHEHRMAATFAGVLAQIAVIDLVFSLDSIITAVGMVDDLPVMIAAVVAAVALMMVAAGPIGRFVSRHPTVKTLALSFLIMVGMALVADGLDFHVPKGYIYFAMAFSVAVEMLNLRMRRNLALPKTKK